jgi:uncharacterized protein YkwD
MSRRPHRALSAFARHLAIAIVCVVLLAGIRATGAEAARMSACAGDAGAAEQEMQCLIDVARVQNRVGRLRHSRVLDRAARLKAQAIRRCRAFSHTPCGRRFTAVYVTAGYPVSRRTVGENLEWGTGAQGSAAFVLRAWLASPEHRRNLLDPRFRELGLCALQLPRFLGRPNVTLWVASFGG